MWHTRRVLLYKRRGLNRTHPEVPVRVVRALHLPVIPQLRLPEEVRRVLGPRGDELDHHVAGVHVDDRQGPHLHLDALGQVLAHQHHHVVQLGLLAVQGHLGRPRTVLPEKVLRLLGPVQLRPVEHVHGGPLLHPLDARHVEVVGNGQLHDVADGRPRLLFEHGQPHLDRVALGVDLGGGPRGHQGLRGVRSGRVVCVRSRRVVGEKPAGRR